jgi:DNA-binding XRE family transcriptional regulator
MTAAEVRNLRKESRLSLRGLADEIGLSPKSGYKTLMAIEAGKKKPTAWLSFKLWHYCERAINEQKPEIDVGPPTAEDKAFAYRLGFSDEDIALYWPTKVLARG